MSGEKILVVDDDEKILRGIERQVGDDFDITTALGPSAALAIEAQKGPFALVISDMRMPEMNGVEFLTRIRQRSPDTVRMILTGFADMNDIIQSVNEGHIFRFLSKPCPPEVLSSSIQQGLKQYGLIKAEKELVEGTLQGCVKVLGEVLSMLNPLAFGQATRVRRTIDGIVKRIRIEQPWQLEMAATLSPLGFVTLPEELLTRQITGRTLSLSERNLVAGHPATAKSLLKSIPRLELVAEIVGDQSATLMRSRSTRPSGLRETRILQLAIDFDIEEQHSDSPLHAVKQMEEYRSLYDNDAFEALLEHVKTEREVAFRYVEIEQLVEGMVLADNIETSDGSLLMAKGHRISASAQQRLQNITSHKKLKNRIKVIDADAHKSTLPNLTSPGAVIQPETFPGKTR